MKRTSKIILAGLLIFGVTTTSAFASEDNGVKDLIDSLTAKVDAIVQDLTTTKSDVQALKEQVANTQALEQQVADLQATVKSQQEQIDKLMFHSETYKYSIKISDGKYNDIRYGLGGYKIRLEGEYGIYEATSDPNGHINIQLPSGTYKVIPYDDRYTLKPFSYNSANLTLTVYEDTTKNNTLFIAHTKQ